MKARLLLDDELLARAAKLSAASLHEAAGRAGALPSCLKPVTPDMRLCGRALPVRSPVGDNLWLHKALAAAAPGDVLVADVGEGAEFGYWGEIMATAAIARQVAGLVITGGVRDSLQLAALGLPTFSSSVCIQGTIKSPAGDGAVHEPVRIGEIIVRAGDLVFGDADGVVVLAPETAAAAIPEAEARDAKEALILDQVRAGALTLDVYNL